MADNAVNFASHAINHTRQNRFLCVFSRKGSWSLGFQQGQVRGMVVQGLEAQTQSGGDGAALIDAMFIHEVGYEARACLYRQRGAGGEERFCADSTGNAVGAQRADGVVVQPDGEAQRGGELHQPSVLLQPSHHLWTYPANRGQQSCLDVIPSKNILKRANIQLWLPEQCNLIA